MKKLSLVIAALALVLGTSQCKKQEEPVGGKVITQKVTFTTSFGDGSKLNVEEGIGTLNLSWEEGDAITVTDGAGHSSTLNCTGVTDGGLTGTFTGEIVYETGELTFTVGSDDGLYENQHFIEITKDIIYLKGTSEFKQSGDYGVIPMKLPYAILKVDLAELAPESGSTDVSVKIGGIDGNEVAKVTGVSASEHQFYLLLPLTVTDPTKTTLTFSNGTKTITHTYSLAPNGFYTGGGNGGYAPIMPDYLCFTAEEANSTVKLQKNNSFDLHSLQYNINGNEWIDYTFDDNKGYSISLANVGDKVYFRKAGEGVATNFSTTSSKFAYFVMEGKIAASGNVMSLIDPSCEATAILGEYCFYNLFNGCTSLTAAPELPATNLTQLCYAQMFNGCTSLTAAPELPAINLTQMCYAQMFKGCTSLTAAPALPATTLANNCCQNMFYGCISLTTAPVLPATTLAKQCYQGMFNGCTSLTTAPVLSATTLAENCYQEMFNGCTALATAPALPATTLAKQCCLAMFNGCTALAAAPALSATTLAENCYQEMFKGCTSLTTAPALPATTLAIRCYNQMFLNCTSLTAAPELPATTLADGCYYQMFKGCSKLNYIKVHFTSWDDTKTNNWVQGVSEQGEFHCPDVLSHGESDLGENKIPTGWRVETF